MSDGRQSEQPEQPVSTSEDTRAPRRVDPAALDALRASMIDALTRRIDALPAESAARRRLEAKRATWCDVVKVHTPDAATTPRASETGDSLAALTASLDARAQRPETLATTLDYFHAVWSKLSARRQLRQSLVQVPGNAGPLNSSRLVHRALSLMNDVSPEYLEQFLTYVDTLSALDALTAGLNVSPSAQPDNAARAKAATKPAKGTNGANGKSATKAASPKPAAKTATRRKSKPT